MAEARDVKLEEIGATQRSVIDKHGPRTWEVVGAINDFAWENCAKWGLDFHSMIQLLLAWELERPVGRRVA